MAKQESGTTSAPNRKPTSAADLMVGIGASAGGLDALQRFLRALPERSGLAFILAQHLEAGSENALVEALSNLSPIPIEIVADKTRIRPDTLYIAPSRARLSFAKNRFRLNATNEELRSGSTIDHLFQQLAESLGSKAVGIVLSGAGTDGTLGLKTISDAGGMTIAQSPNTAKFDSMPRSAATTGVADHILPPEQMPKELCSYREHLAQSRGEAEKRLRSSIVESIPSVAKILQAATDHDFRHYKPSTLARRIQRRMQLLKIAEAPSYLERLEADPEECRNLFRELLIGVTEFFRDKAAFEFLEKNVIPRLFEKRRSDEPIRIWTAGCSTGEEAYSLAMLVREHAANIPNAPQVRIFATDIDERALEVARQGLYPLGIAEDVSSERLNRFFVKRGKRYHVSKEIREICVFSQHNLISDPPFSRQDLISCRNLLIYLGSHLQKKIIPLFHYSLRPHGYLFLGPSEGMESHRDLFQQQHPKHRILQRKGSAVSTPAPAVQRQSASARPLEAETPSEGQPDLPRLMQRIVLDEFAPKSVVVNGEGTILCASGDVSDYLAFSNGAFQNNVVKLARPGLRVGLRAALREAKAKKRQIVDDSLSVRHKQGLQQVMLTVQPMPEMGEDSGLYIVVFQSVGLPRKNGQKRVAAEPTEEADALVDQLERELHDTRDELERTIQDLEAVNEELKSSNEELLSMNEELQSTNEEMETSKEEVQIANQSLAQANSDLQNLLSSTRIATLFLDRSGCIRNFTPALAEIYRLIPTDIGRPIEDINTFAREMPPLPSPDELALIGQVEHEIRTLSGDWFIRRVSPYKSDTDKQEGTVVTFTNVTRLKDVTASLELSERALRESQERLSFILASANTGTWIWHKATNEVSWSDNLERIHGRAPGSFEGTFESAFEDIFPEDRPIVKQALQRALSDGAQYQVQYRILLPDGSIRWLESDGQGAYTKDGELISLSGLCRDISDRKLSEQRLRTEHAVSHAIAECRTLAEAAPKLLKAFAEKLGVEACELWLPDDSGERLRILASHAAEESGEALAEFREKGRSLSVAKGELLPGRVWVTGEPVWHLDDELARSLARAPEAAAASLRVAVGFPIVAKQKTIGVFAFYARRRVQKSKELAKMMLAIGLDLGQQVLRDRAETAIRASEARFRTLANVVPVLVWTSGTDKRYNYFNQRWLEFTGRPMEQEIGTGWAELVHPDDRERCLRIYEEAFDRRENFRMEFRLKRRDGQYRWIVDEGAPMFGPNDSFTGYIGGCVDITDAKETEFALRQASDQRRLALQAADIGSWDWNLLEDTVFLDPRCRELLGVPAEIALTSESAVANTLPGDRERLDCSMTRAVDPATGGSVQLEFRVKHDDQSIHWLSALGEVSFEGEGDERKATRFVGTLQDVTERKRAEDALRDHARTLEIVNDVTLQLAGELDLETLVQSVTDAGRELTGAAFGAFFYNQATRTGESLMLYSLSGAPREAFENFPMPRDTAIFEPAFSGRGITRSDDITADPNYGKDAPFHALSTGDRPVRSYLSVPVIGRDGETIGGLFYGHPEPGVFTEQHATILRGVAAQAAVAVGNARLYTAQIESEQRYRHLLQTGHDAVYLYPLDETGNPGKLIDVNEQATRQLGYSREELLSLRPIDLVDAPPATMESIYQRLMAEETLIVQNRHRAKDGKILPVEVSATLVHLDGTPHVISKARDITDRLQVEEDLRRSERLYRGIGESMNFGIWICDANGRNTYTSESLLKLVGMTQAECSEYGWIRVLHPEERESTLDAWKRVVKEGDFWEREHRMLGVDGEYHHILARGVPIRDESGAIAQWAGINLDIGQLKRAETALRDSEERFKAYFESSPTPLWEKDWSAVKEELDRLAAEHPDLRATLLARPELARHCLSKTRIIDANAAAVELFKAADRHDMILNGDRIVTNRTSESMAEILCALEQGSGRFRIEEEIVTFDEQRRFVLCEFVAMPGHEKGLKRVLVSRVDITDRRRAEEAAALTAAVGAEISSGLANDKTLVKLAQTVVPSFADWCAVDLVNEDGTTQRVATAHADPQKAALVEELYDGFARKPGAGLGKVLATKEADWRSEIPAELLKSDALHLSSYICVPLIARDTLLGAITFAAAESGRRYDSQDLAVALEIAQHASQAIDNVKLYKLQIEALSEAKEAQALLDTIIATAPVGVALLDRELRFAQVNNLMAEMNGISPEAHKGIALAELLPDLWPEIQPICRKLLDGSKSTSRIEYKRRAADGDRSFVYTFYAIHSARGEAVGIGTLVEEITERKRFEETLARARQQAETANQSKSEFLANMSHEIRTPMTSILGYSDILRQNLEDPDDIQCVNTIRRNGEFLLEIINDILDLSRIESGHLEVDLERCQPDMIIGDVVSLMDVRAKEKRLNLEVVFEGQIPETIETDPVRLRQVLVNLLGNAVKFTERGSVKLEVRFLPESEQMRCDVVDTGIGMKPEQLARIFQPFRQADTSVSRRFGGSGLGLTICDRLVQMLGGEIRADSKAGEGSVFTFTIRTGSLAGVPMVEPRIGLDSSSRSVAGENVSLDCRALVVDDRREIRQLAQHYIEEAGGKAAAVENGAQCIEAVQRAEKQGQPFDIVIIDMQMPVMDGYEATRRLRSLGYKLPIIALTAHAMKGDREKSIAAGCTDYATKPIDETSLIGLIAKHVPTNQNPQPDASEPDSADHDSATGRRLLIVEDNANLRRILALTFQKRGHDVRVAASAEDALEIAPVFRPEIGLIDLGLPDMTGLDLVQRLRQMPELDGARLFALSGRDSSRDIQRSEEAGFDRHIVKPPDMDELERLFRAELPAR